MRHLVAFSWYGGKYYMLKKMLPEFPSDCSHLVDVFGGSGVVCLNATGFSAKTWNDIDSEVVNFFRVLREDSDNLIRSIRLTPYSREEFNLSFGDVAKGEPLERARRFYIRIVQGFNSTPSAGGTWGFNKEGRPCRARAWANRPSNLEKVASCLKDIQIENDDAVSIIKRYDSPTTFFYCDPPYLHSERIGTKKYSFEMSDAQHRELGEALNSITGKAMVSGYYSNLYSELFSDWRVKSFERYNVTTRQQKRVKKVEYLWLNYESDPAEYPLTFGTK